jgi:UDP-N-acetylmuramoyl-tripeptide--D-alanyl-D-alanine ligase
MSTPIPTNHAKFSIWDILAATGGTLVQPGEGDDRVVGVGTDSRAIVPGNAFFAITGENQDGHRYAVDAAKGGARVLVVARGRAPSEEVAVGVIEVDDPLIAWGDLARAHLRAWRRARHRQEGGSPRPRVVAITGSAGKTTTKEICGALLSAVGSCLMTRGNLNNRVGMPAVLFCAEPHHQSIVLEVGMSLPGEMAALASIAEPDVGVITNAGFGHAQGVGGKREDVAREKGTLIAMLSCDGTAVVNQDDGAAYGQMSRIVARGSETFGRHPDATYRMVERTALGVQGSRVRFTRREASGEEGPVQEVSIPIGGEAAALDLLGALAAAEAVHGSRLDAAFVDGALRAIAPLPGHGLIMTLEDGTIVLDDSYNANPNSMRDALGKLADVARREGRRAVAILGEMKELGPSSPELHDSLGPLLVASGVSLVVGCGGLIERTLDLVAAQGVPIQKTRNAAEAAVFACEVTGPQDVVLVKGSLSVGMKQVVDALVGRARANKAVQ